MKKLLAIVVLGSLLVGCGVQNYSEFRKKSWSEREYMLINRDLRFNLFENDKNNIYLATFSDLEERYTNYAHSVNPSNKWYNPLDKIAKKHCMKLFNSEEPSIVEIYKPTKDEIKDKKLFHKKYTKYECLNPKPNYVENKKSKEIKSAKVSNNTLNRTFNCSYPSGSSKIRIRGGTATELTSAGVEIKYNYVELTKKGAFSLEQSTKPGRVFFIGAQSFLGLGGAEFYNAVCR